MPLNPVPNLLAELLAGSDVDALLDSLRATNASIVCADTCVFLDLVRNYFQTNRNTPDTLDVLNKFSELIAQKKIQLIIPETVNREMWDVNVGNYKTVQKGRRDWISEALERLPGFIKTFQQATGASISLPRELDKSVLDQLLDHLKTAIEDIFNASIVLSETPSVLNNSHSRQIKIKRPAKVHKNSVGDCLLIETLFGFAEGIRARNIGNPLIFVTSNKSDFGDETNSKKPHPDLKPDFDRLGIEYYISIIPVLWNL